MQFIDLAAQYNHLKEKIDARIHQVLDHGKYIMGPEVSELEDKLADYVGVKHAVTCANGTDALTLALMVLDVKEGDAVFCPTFTFFATAETVSFANATPVFVDSDEITFNICPQDLEARIKKTLSEGKLTPKAIIAVDLFGLPADYPEIERIARKYDLKIIEDAAQGFGGSIDGKKAGSFGDIATTSFFPAKPLGCYGDGGAVFTNNDEYAEKIKMLRVHGQNKRYHHKYIGLGARLDTIQAAILLAKLPYYAQEIEARQAVAKEYNDYLQGTIITPSVKMGRTSVWAQYSVRVNNREEVQESLRQAGIPTAVHYPIPLHLQECFRYLGLEESDHPIAKLMSKEVLSLPMNPFLAEDEIRYVGQAINNICSADD